MLGMVELAACKQCKQLVWVLTRADLKQDIRIALGPQLYCPALTRGTLFELHLLQDITVKTLETRLTTAQHENISLRAQLLRQQALLEKHGHMTYMA
jgi:hypothetical protein